MRLHSLTFDELIANGISPKFARILTDPKSYHSDLDIILGKTDWDYYVPADVTKVFPLWDTNADSVVRWNRNGMTEYVRLYHDDPEWRFLASSEQGIMATLWQNWIEFQESDDEIRQFAEAIGFRHWQEGFKLLESNYDAFKKWILELSDD